MSFIFFFFCFFERKTRLVTAKTYYCSRIVLDNNAPRTDGSCYVRNARPRSRDVHVPRGDRDATLHNTLILDGGRATRPSLGARAQDERAHRETRDDRVDRGDTYNYTTFIYDVTYGFPPVNPPRATSQPITPPSASFDLADIDSCPGCGGGEIRGRRWGRIVRTSFLIPTPTLIHRAAFRLRWARRRTSNAFKTTDARPLYTRISERPTSEVEAGNVLVVGFR